MVLPTPDIPNSVTALFGHRRNSLRVIRMASTMDCGRGDYKAVSAGARLLCAGKAEGATTMDLVAHPRSPLPSQFFPCRGENPGDKRFPTRWVSNWARAESFAPETGNRYRNSTRRELNPHQLLIDCRTIPEVRQSAKTPRRRGLREIEDEPCLVDPVSRPSRSCADSGRGPGPGRAGPRVAGRRFPLWP